MAFTIERRIRRTILAATLLTLVVIIASVLVANENLEASMLELGFESQRDFIVQSIRPDSVTAWDTQMLKAYYAPAGATADARMPSVFQALPIPFSGELDVEDRTYLVTTSVIPGGNFFLAQDISLFEAREAQFHRFLALLAAAVVVMGIVLARLTGKHLSAPIQQLAAQIRSTTAASRMPRVRADYREAELQAIANAFNLFLGELEAYVKREQSLMGLASHELRTPIAVIAGALDVLEQRGDGAGLAAAPLARMRRAADEMTGNIDVILRLTRRKGTTHRLQSICLETLMQEVRDDLERQMPDVGRRVAIHAAGCARVEEDPVLVKMLLRNLVQNAVQHTQGHIRISIDEARIAIDDEGEGLPPAYVAYLQDPRADAAELLSMSGLGLFIVTLICERLGWRLEAVPLPDGGARLQVRLSRQPA